MHTCCPQEVTTDELLQKEVKTVKCEALEPITVKQSACDARDQQTCQQNPAASYAKQLE